MLPALGVVDTHVAHRRARAVGPHGLHRQREYAAGREDVRAVALRALDEVFAAVDHARPLRPTGAVFDAGQIGCGKNRHLGSYRFATAAPSAGCKNTNLSAIRAFFSAISLFLYSEKLLLCLRLRSPRPLCRQQTPLRYSGRPARRRCARWSWSSTSAKRTPRAISTSCSTTATWPSISSSPFRDSSSAMPTTTVGGG